MATDTDLLDRLKTALGGAYEIERELGGGGMSRVFVATETALGRLVVVKVLPLELSGAVSAERFRREVQLAARLQHPHIVPLLTAGDTAGRHDARDSSGGASEGLLYYTMPYVAGESLRGRLAREAQLPVADAVRIARDVADALAYAHAQGVVHRDMKPENILLDAGHALVADFGIARAVTLAAGGEVALTSTGLALGTPRYMSPEQATAERDVDARSDVYSLGVVLYEMLAGEPPFGGATPQAAIARMLTESTPSVRRARASVPEHVEQVVTRALAKVPADRFQTAGEMRAALEDPLAVASPGTSAEPGQVGSSKDTRATVWRRRVMIGSGVLALTLAGSALWYRTADRGRTSDLPTARRVLVVPFENATGDPALAPLGRMAADWVAQGLAMTGVVEVTGAPTLGAVGSEGELKVAAARNGAGTVVSGTYYMEGDSVRLQARVTDVTDWKVVRPVAPVSASRSAPSKLLDPLRQRVMAVLAVDHDPRYAALNTGAPPPTYEAYDEFLAGVDVFERGDFGGAIPYFTRAAALDSSYVQPLVRAADAYMIIGRLPEADTLVSRLERSRQSFTPADRASVARLRGVIDGDRMAELAGARAVAAAAPGAQLPYFQQALSASAAARPGEALAAIARAPEFGRTRPVLVAGTYWSVVTTAHHMLADYEAELQAANEARRYHPESREILGDQLRALAALGRLDELAPRLDELEAMAPPERRSSIPALLISLAEELDTHGHAKTAREVLQRAVAWQRAQSPQEQQGSRARSELARALYLLGDYDAAQPLFEALAAAAPADKRYVLQLGLIDAHRRHRVEAEQIGERLRALKGPYDQGRTTYALAELAAVLGDRDAAVALLRQALAEGVDYGQRLHANPNLASLRDDPRFRELLKPKG